MKAKEFDLLMTEIREVKHELKEVRQIDIPAVHTSIAIADERMKELKEQVSKDADRKAKIYGGVGSALAFLFSIVVSHFKR